MRYLRFSLAWVLLMALAVFPIPAGSAARPAIGILTSARRAHLNDTSAFPGLSVFEGERLSTEPKGELSVRIDAATLALGSRSEIVLVPLEPRLHVDLALGSLHFSDVKSSSIEVHAEEALIWPATAQATRGSILIVARKLLQITAERGDLNFSYRDEFRVLPEGQTFRIYLDSPTGPDEGTTGGVQKAGAGSKVAYFIVGSGVAAITAWGVHEAVKSEQSPISPAKP